MEKEIKTGKAKDERNISNQEKRSNQWIADAMDYGFTEEQAIFLHNKFFNLMSI
jgi:hypothetical protein